MPTVQNKGLIFTKIPTAIPVPGEHLTISADRTFDTEQAPPPNGITVRNHYVSFDPYQRGRMREAGTTSYIPAFTLGQPMTNFAVSRVLKSNNDKFQPGTVIVTGASTPTEEYSVLGPEALEGGTRPLENPLGLDPAVFLGPLGMPGLTAFSSFYEILGGTPALAKGKVIFVSAASGAVGQIVGQIAKREGMVVVGSVGDDRKLEYITKELGFDGGFNYKKEKPADGLKRCAPDGIDVYYENVGGEHLEAALEALNKKGVIIACGMVSQYNVAPDDRYPIRNLMQIVAKSLTIRGFIVMDPDFGGKHFAEHQQKVQQWIADGSMKSAIDVTRGIDGAAEGFVGMLQGKNFGKALVEIAKL